MLVDHFFTEKSHTHVSNTCCEISMIFSTVMLNCIVLVGGNLLIGNQNVVALQPNT